MKPDLLTTTSSAPAAPLAAALCVLLLGALVLPGCSTSSTGTDVGLADVVAKDVPFVPEDIPGDLPDPPGTCSGTFRVENLDGTPADPPSEGAQFLFRPEALGHFELELAPEDWAWLQANALEETYVPASVVYEGLRYHGVAVRFKGAWSTLLGCFDDAGNQTCPKLSVKLRFNKYDRCGRFYGLRRLVFNSNSHDVTHMRERLMYNLLAKAGMMGSRAAHATLAVNDGDASLYTIVEPVDKEYLESRFDDPQGNLYKETWPIHDQAEMYVTGLRTNEGEADVSHMLEFAAALATASSEQYEDELAPFLDLDHLAQMAAFARAVGDDDGFLRFWCPSMFSACENHNYYWYDEPGADVRLLPWDLDITFYGFKTLEEISLDWWNKPSDCSPVPLYIFENIDDPGPGDYELVLPPQCDPLLSIAVGQRPAVYLETLEAVAQGLGETIDEFDTVRTQIEETLMADPLIEFDHAEWVSEANWLKKKLGQQKEVIEELLTQLDN